MSTLPNTYQQVEYIESGRTQYIDTGVNADYKLSVFAEMAILSDGAMGAINNLGNAQYLRHHFNYNNSQGIKYYYKAVDGDSIQLIAPSDVDTNKHTYLVDIYNNIKQIDESSPESIRTRDSFDTQLNYWLFKRNSNVDNLKLNLPIKLYSFKMYYENTLVRDFIPCYRKSDREIGLYDLVNNVFYTNQGTGTFIKGNAPLADKLSYLRETKSILKEKINNIGGELTNLTTFRKYTEELDKLYSELPKTSQDGTSVSLANTRRGKLEITPKGNAEQDGIPSEYQVVDYIQSDGNQYINTGVLPNFNTKVEFDFISTASGTATSGFIYGGRISSTSGSHACIMFPASKDWYPQFSTDTSVVHLTDTYPDLAQNGVKYKIINSKDGFYINGIKIKTYNETDFESAIYPQNQYMYIFGLNQAGSLESRTAKIKLYSFRIYENDVLIREYIPCYRKADDEIGLYETQTNTFYTNQGTGSFVKGNNAYLPNPSNERKVKVVTGNNNVIIKGLNSLDNTKFAKVNPSQSVTPTFKDGKVIINGAAGSGGSDIRIESSTPFLTLKAGTYTFLFNEATTNWNCELNINALHYGNYKLVKGMNTNKRILVITLDSDLDIYNLNIHFRPNITFTNQELWLMILEGEYTAENAPDFEPYIEPIEKELNLGNLELAKIGDYSDLIFKNEKTSQYYDNTLIENAWYKLEKIKKRFLLGTGNWGISNNVFYTSEISDYSRENNVPYCNFFAGENNKSSTGDVFGDNVVAFNNTYDFNRFYIKSSELDAIRPFLQENRVVLYYLKDTANISYEQITDTTLINQLEEINSIIGTGGTVVIETESEEENAQLIVNASALASFENE